MSHSITTKYAVGTVQLFTLALFASIFLGAVAAVYLAMYGYKAGQFKSVMMVVFAVSFALVFIHSEPINRLRAALSNFYLSIFLIGVAPGVSLALGSSFKSQMVIYPVVALFLYLLVDYFSRRIAMLFVEELEARNDNR